MSIVIHSKTVKIIDYAGFINMLVFYNVLSQFAEHVLF